jgi:uncharacterized protein with FMN-binding domain
MQLQNKIAFSALAGLSLLTAITGCSSATTPANATSEAPAATTPAAAASSTPSGVASSGAAASTSTFRDGSYVENGSYQSPAGTAEITVKLSLANDIVTAVTVTGHASDPSAKQYQDDFISGISGQVVGKKISDLNVTKVSGSSLTSNGFRAAVAKIQNEARA